MYERSYGYRYAEVGDHPTNAEIAKAIRRDIKQAIAEGLLPAHWTYSVRSDDLAVNVEVRDCPDAWQPCDGTVPGSRRDFPDGGSVTSACPDVWCKARNDPAYAHAAHEHEVLTEDARAARMTLDRIHGAYNHDGSEIQVDYFDVRYYGHVEFEDARSAAWRAEEKERLAAKRRAKESGRVAGRVQNHKRDGTTVVHVLIDTDDGRKVLACGARVWRGSLLSKVSDDAAVTCSRCARRAEEVA